MGNKTESVYGENNLNLKYIKICIFYYILSYYIPFYLEAYCINNILRVYKRRGLITEEEIPKFEKSKLEAQVAEYRRAKREAKKGE